MTDLLMLTDLQSLIWRALIYIAAVGCSAVALGCFLALSHIAVYGSQRSPWLTLAILTRKAKRTVVRPQHVIDLQSRRQQRAALAPWRRS